MGISIKRIYDAPAPSDGARVLIDRLWPRGVSKIRAALTLWMKDVAPSPELREWFGHSPDRMDAFAEKYRQELSTDSEKQQAASQLLDMARKGPVTLLYGAKDPHVNHAVVLQAYLREKQLGKG
ncbi:DUF488 domain-containing protein [Eubacteriales bacterium OttesenSCG-928-A19]|nr:DUF488 domain-containing protein [Eubacteriales bacterium OttesenSCG-928-A19]